MRKFVNNWVYELGDVLPAGELSLPLPAGALEALALAPGDEVVLTITSSLYPLEQLAFEFVRLQQGGGVTTVERGALGTADAEWPAGAVIYASLPAEQMSEWHQAIAALLSRVQALEDASTAVATWGGIGGDIEDQLDLQALFQGVYDDLALKATAADLSAVATSGSYADLLGAPAIPVEAGDVGAVPAAAVGAPGGVAGLDAEGKIPLAQIPAAAISNTFVVNTEAAMLALDVQVGDVAIRPDITSSFILQVEPASVLGNWQQILTPSLGGGAPVGSAMPQALGTASPGVSGNASREDHVHPLPTPGAIGAVPAEPGKGLSTEDYSTADKAKLGGIAPGATANQTDAHLLSRANHTGTQAMSTVDGLEAALAGRQAVAQVVTESTTARTLGLADAGVYLRCTNAAATAVTVSPQASVAWAAHAEIHIRRAGAGNLTLTPGSGVTLNAPAGGSLVLADRMGVTLKRAAENVWDVIGQTVPA